MKRKIAMLFPMLSLFVLSACTPGHMVVKSTKLDVKAVKPEPGKSAIFVARTTSFGGAVSFETFLDQQMIGVTKGKSYFVKTNITPGTHYVIAKTESFETAKIEFKPDRVYFIQQTPRMGFWMARVTLEPVSAEHMLSEMDESCSYMEYDNSGDVLSEEDFGKAVKDYEREVGEGYHKEFAEYKGFAVK